MQKTLNILSYLIKMLTVAAGATTATDATSVLHLSGGALGSVVSGLGVAALVVKTLQSQTPTSGS